MGELIDVGRSDDWMTRAGQSARLVKSEMIKTRFFAFIGALFNFDVQFRHQPPILFMVLTDEPSELLGAAAHQLLGGFQELFADRWIGKNFSNFGIETRDNRGWRPCRCKDAEPLVEHKSLDASLLKGRHFRQARRTRFACLRQKPHVAHLVVRNERRRPDRPDLHVTCNEVVDRRTATAIRHGREPDAGNPGKPQGRDRLRGGKAGSCVPHPWPLFGQRNQFVDGIRSQRGMNGEHHRLAGELDDGDASPLWDQLSSSIREGYW